MKKVYSEIEPKTLLCVVAGSDEIKEGRLNLSPEEEYLQVSVIKEHKWKRFKPHYHIKTKKEVLKTQEMWVIIKGAVVFWIYDVNNEKYRQFYLKSGDIVVTFNGGHHYEIVEHDTVVVEVKNGPYISRKEDKKFINES